MKTFAVLALGAAALGAAACMPQGQGGYNPSHNSSVAYNPSYDNDHRRPPLPMGGNNGAAYQGNGQYQGQGQYPGNGGHDGPPPWPMGNNGQGQYQGNGQDRGHDGPPPPWAMANNGTTGGTHHDGPPPPWAGNGNNGGNNGSNGMHGPQGGPPDQHGYCGPVVFPGCTPRG